GDGGDTAADRRVHTTTAQCSRPDLYTVRIERIPGNLPRFRSTRNISECYPGVGRHVAPVEHAKFVLLNAVIATSGGIRSVYPQPVIAASSIISPTNNIGCGCGQQRLVQITAAKGRGAIEPIYVVHPGRCVLPCRQGGSR